MIVRAVERRAKMILVSLSEADDGDVDSFLHFQKKVSQGSSPFCSLVRCALHAPLVCSGEVAGSASPVLPPS